MKQLAATSLLALIIAPLALQADPHEEPEAVEEAHVLRFAFPGAERQVMLQVRARGARLGIGLGDWAEGAVEGLSVVSVSPGGPADQSGLRSGDMLTTINGESLAADSGQESYERLREALAAVKPGSDVSIGYRRGEEELEVQLATSSWEQLVEDRNGVRVGRMAKRIGNWARNMSNWSAGDRNVEVEVDVDEDGQERRIVRIRRGAPEPLAFYDMAWRLGGLQITELTPALGEYFGAEHGLLVVRAPHDEDVPLEDGDVIQKIGGREFKDARHATRILRSYEPGEKVELEVLRHKRRKDVSFELPVRSRELIRGHFMAPPEPAAPASPTEPGSSPETT